MREDRSMGAIDDFEPAAAPQLYPVPMASDPSKWAAADMRRCPHSSPAIPLHHTRAFRGGMATCVTGPGHPSLRSAGQRVRRRHPRHGVTELSRRWPRRRDGGGAGDGTS